MHYLASAAVCALIIVSPFAAAGQTAARDSAAARYNTAAPRPRPCLFFDAGQVEALKAKCAGPAKPQFDALVKYADEHLADVPPARLEGDNEKRGLQVEHPFLTNILDYSFLYVVTREPKYLDAAKRWTLALAAMDEWEGKVVPENKEGDRGLYTGFGLTALAAAYDWLYNDLTDAERDVIRAKIASRSEAIHRATFEGEWWSGGYLHHDLWIPVAGMGLGAVAVIDEVPEAKAWAQRADEEFFQALGRLGTDGAWPEGPAGWAFAMASFIPYWDAYSRRFPTALDRSEWLSNTWKFRLYSRVPDGQFLWFGDGRPTGHYQWTAYQAAPTLRFLASKFMNPCAQWLAAREWETRPNPYTAVWEIIWLDTSVRETPPDALPQSTFFENQGLAYLRTGWTDKDTAVRFHCDSLVGKTAATYYDNGDAAMNTATDHTHADANSFCVWSRGAFAFNAAAYGRKATKFENSVLIDGQGQYGSFDAKERPGRPRGEVTRFFASNYASFVEGEASRAYPPGIGDFTRTVCLVQPGVVFLRDSIAAEKPVRVDWLVHVPRTGLILTSLAGFSHELEKTQTIFRLARPLACEITVEAGPADFAVNVANPSKASRADLLAALVPCMNIDAKAEVKTPTDHCLVVETADTKLLAVFADQKGKLEMPGRLAGRGEMAVVTVVGSERGFLAVDSAELTLDGQQLLVSGAPVTVSCQASADGGSLTISAGEPTQVALDPGMPVKSLRRGDGRSVPYLTEGPRIILSVTEGTTTYDLVRGQGERVGGN